MSTNRVWCEFSVKSKIGHQKLRIQDASEDRLEDVADIFATYFAAEETFHKLAGVSKNKEAQQECKEFVTEMMKDCNIVMCCLDDESDDKGKIIAASLMSLIKKEDSDQDTDIKTRTKEMGRMFELVGQVFEMYDAIKEFKLDSFYDGRGVVVLPDYRGLGIAQKLFYTRRLICKEEGVPMTGAWVTTHGSQKAAARDGWDTAFEIPYEELGKLLEVTFDGVPPTCKFMVATVK